jgi:hypothetical protein
MPVSRDVCRELVSVMDGRAAGRCCRSLQRLRAGRHSSLRPRHCYAVCTHGGIPTQLQGDAEWLSGRAANAAMQPNLHHGLNDESLTYQPCPCRTLGALCQLTIHPENIPSHLCNYSRSMSNMMSAYLDKEPGATCRPPLPGFSAQGLCSPADPRPPAGPNKHVGSCCRLKQQLRSRRMRADSLRLLVPSSRCRLMQQARFRLPRAVSWPMVPGAGCCSSQD